MDRVSRCRNLQLRPEILYIERGVGDRQAIPFTGNTDGRPSLALTATRDQCRFQFCVLITIGVIINEGNRIANDEPLPQQTDCLS